MARRRRRLRLVVVALGLAFAALALTSRTSCRNGMADAEVAPSALPDEPFARCAVKALRGDYGQLAEWQRVGYARGLEVGAVPVRVWATTYYPEEGFPRGARTASGYGCSERVAAANLIPRYAFVWTPATGIRQVLDTGARRNDAVAQRRYGAECWVDFWEPRRGLLFGDDNAYVRTVWVIERRAR